MSLYLQHGFGKGSKIDNLSGTQGVSGVFLSPADEDSATLRATAASARRNGLATIVDPQTYVYSANPAGAGRRHDDHGLDFGRIHWSQDAKAVEKLVSRVRSANEQLGTDAAMIAPTCIQSSFADVWTPLALQFARTAASEWGSEATIAAVCIEDGALANWHSVADWLDVVTTLDVRGFYLTVDRRRREYPSMPWDAVRLKNLLRVIYNLAVVNEYEVYWGYSDIEGLMGITAGATAIGSGWTYGLRNFAVSKWQPSTSKGGQAAAPRIHIGKLWTPLRAEDEAKSIFQSSLRDEIFPKWALKRFATNDFTTWTRLEAQEHHLELLARRAEALSAVPDVGARIQKADNSLGATLDRFTSLSRLGIQLPPAYRSRVAAFRDSLDLLAEEENL